MTIKIDISQSRWTKLSSEENRVLDAIAHRINKSRKTLVVTGAGISCNAGIPDFRSQDGLYNMVKHQHPGVVVKGKDLFDSIVFSEEKSAAVFYTFMAELRRSILKAKPTAAHRFIKTLKTKNKLMRCYTQNIDGLESHVGLTIGGSLSLTDSKTISSISERLPNPAAKLKDATILKHLDVVQLHGDIHSLRCNCCGQTFEWSPSTTKIMTGGESPECPSCISKSDERLARGMRPIAVGSLRPSIVLYGEEHPHGDIIGTCIAKDAKSRPEVMLIIGTTMKVVGLKKLVRDVAKSMKQGASNKKPGQRPQVIFVNKADIGMGSWDDVIDYHIKCDCDEWIKDLKNRVPDLFAIQTKIDKFTAKSVAPKSSEDELVPITLTEEVVVKEKEPVPEVSGILMTPRKPRASKTAAMLLLTPPSSRRSGRKKETSADHKTLIDKSVPPDLSYITPSKTPVRSSKRIKKDSNYENIFNDVECPNSAGRLLFDMAESPLSKKRTRLDDCVAIERPSKKSCV